VNQKSFSIHAPVRIELRLPMPPSANHYWRMFVLQKTPRMIISAEGRAYREAVFFATRKEFNKATGPLRVTIQICYGTRRKIDLDNRLKSLLDALTHAGVYEDDSQIDFLSVERGPVSPPDGYCDVVVESVASDFVPFVKTAKR
jgi:crossover junction endodeoxyribonuclease RusA